MQTEGRAPGRFPTFPAAGRKGTQSPKITQQILTKQNRLKNRPEARFGLFSPACGGPERSFGQLTQTFFN